MRWSVSTSLGTLCLCFTATSASPAGFADQHDQTFYLHAAQSVLGAMQQPAATTGYWNASTGLWDEAWWNSARVVTMYANLALHRPTAFEQKPGGQTLLEIFETVYRQASNGPGHAGHDFILPNDSGYFDDDLWWANAWISVYRVYPDRKYLDLAKKIVREAKRWWYTGQNSVVESTGYTGGASKKCMGLQ